MSALDAVVAAAVMFAGCAVQGAVGFGANLVAAPLLVLIDPRFVPGPTVVATGMLNLLVIRREGTGRVDHSVDTAIVGQVVGVLGAGLLLVLVTDEALSVLFAALVLLAVALSIAGWHLAKTRCNLLGVGLLSGFMGTVSGIGGPPIALVYQHADGPTLRGTLARYFTAGNAVAIPTLILAGRLGRAELPHVAVLVPGAIAGYAASGWLAGHLDKRTARPIILGLSTAAALAVLAALPHLSTVGGMTDEQPIDVVRRFCAAWGTEDLDTIIGFFTDDAVYHNIPVAPVVGPTAIKATIEGFSGGVESIEFRLDAIAADGPTVLTERLDVFTFPKGRVELPVMGTFEVRDGKIAAWRDYFDMAMFLNQL